MGIFRRFRKPQKATGPKPPWEIYKDEPPGIRAFLLNQLALELGEREIEKFLKGKKISKKSEAYSQEADRLWKMMIHRNQHGIEFEKAGKVDQAIELYEQNAADCFDGTHPYNRLRIIYSKRKQYCDAIRVCQAFVSTMDRFIESGIKEENMRSRRDKFQEWIVKLEKRREKAE